MFYFGKSANGENIGASARGMWNFGLERMRIVSPRDGWPNQKRWPWQVAQVDY